MTESRYQLDSPETLYNEFCDLEARVVEVGENCKRLATVEANAIADYEDAKNKKLIELFAEEMDENFKGKRTEKQREAIYRLQFNTLRLRRGLAQADVKSERDLLKALDSKMSALQSRKGLMMAEWEKYSRTT